jgi:glycerol 3-phosphatase-2
VTYAVAAPLSEATRAPAERFDVALLDLDGVVYIGAHAVPGAIGALAAARSAGMRLAYVTNNAARPPEAVAEHLVALGIEATAGDVITSSQAAARYLSERLDPGAHVLVVGTTGLYVALRERGLVPVSSADDDPAAVVQGYSPTLDWGLLAEGAVAIERGLPWVATNIDPTVPSPRGPLPGNGSLVAALRHATGATPVVTGKPDPAMHRETMLRTRATAPLIVGDRLDTDIEGANATDTPSLLVMTGVTGAADLVAAEPALRPTYVAWDLRGLLEPHPEVIQNRERAHCRDWTAYSIDAELHLAWGGADTASHVRGSTEANPMDALRALCVAAWASADAAASTEAVDRSANGAGGGRPPACLVVPDDSAASAAIRELGLG